MLFRGVVRWGGWRDLALVRWWRDFFGFEGELWGIVIVVWVSQNECSEEFSSAN